MKIPSRLFSTLLVLFGTFSGNGQSQETGEENQTAPGLIATFRDGASTVSEVVPLPELGLTADESPHPAIRPAFSVRYEGFLHIAQAGTYEFDTKGTLTLGGESVTGGHELDAGKHLLSLTYEREPGDLRFGLSWQSGHFVQEPVPPDALFHIPGASPPENTGGSHPAPQYRIRGALAKMKCASCHDAGFLSTIHHKYQPDALLTLMRHANPPKWYGALTGPLLEENETIIQLATDLQKLPNGSRRRAQPADNPNEGRTMIGTRGGMACIACHDLLHHKTEAESKGPNLALISDRVSYDWFVRWMDNPQRLKPGVPMPPFFAGQEAVERQRKIDALWDYLSQGERMKLPEELRVDPNQFVLKSAARPIFTRTYFVLSDGRELRRAICVGLPNGVSYCFDAETCRLVYVWTGGFLNMAPHWQNQSGMPTPAIGTPFFLLSPKEGLQIGEHEPQFRGYEMSQGIPRFEFLYGETMVSLLIDAPNPDQVRLTFTIGKCNEPITYVGPPADGPVAVKSSKGKWEENHLTVAATEELSLVVTYSKTQ